MFRIGPQVTIIAVESLELTDPAAAVKPSPKALNPSQGNTCIVEQSVDRGHDVFKVGDKGGAGSCRGLKLQLGLQIFLSSATIYYDMLPAAVYASRVLEPDKPRGKSPAFERTEADGHNDISYYSLL